MEDCRKNIYLTERYQCTPQIRFNLNCTQFAIFNQMASTVGLIEEQSRIMK
jgi:hypothetical protein